MPFARKPARLRLTQPLTEEAQPEISFAFQMMLRPQVRIVNGGENWRPAGISKIVFDREMI
jgi:hypothetical protein